MPSTTSENSRSLTTSLATQSDVPLPGKPVVRTKRPAALRSAVWSNFVDQFDIFVPVIALAPANASLFGSDNLARTAGLVFVATLIGRPLGALFFGPIADRLGRKAVSVITLGGIALTAFAIAATPDHTVWGIWMLIWVLCMRVLGGAFLGGQYSAAIPLAMEWAGHKRRGLVSGLIMGASPLANATIAGLTLSLLAVLDVGEYASWGWRVPFVVAGVLAASMMAMYLKSVTDFAHTPGGIHPQPGGLYKQPGGIHPQPGGIHPQPGGLYKQPSGPKKATRNFQHRPVGAVVIGSHRGIFVRVFVLMSGLWLLTNMAVPVVTQQLSATNQWSSGQVTMIMMCGTAASIFTMVACGQISTLLGRSRFFVFAGVAIVCVAPASYLLMWQGLSLGGVIACVVAIQVFTVSAYGPIGAHLSEQFPAHVRSTGYGLGYSLSIVVPALYPYYLPSLQELVGVHGAVALLLALGGCFVFLGGLLVPERAALNY